MANKKEVIEFLKDCNECDLLSIIGALSDERRITNGDGTSERVFRKYLLASVSYDIEGEQVVEEPSFSFLGSPQDKENWLSTATEFGDCIRCKTAVSGFCTHSICPVCEHYVALT